MCMEEALCSSVFGKCLARISWSSLGQPSFASALAFFLGHPLPCCRERGCGASLSRCANFPPLLAESSGHRAGTARAELNCKRLPKLTSGSWPPTSAGREVTAEGVAEGGLLLSLCFGGGAFHYFGCFLCSNGSSRSAASLQHCKGWWAAAKSVIKRALEQLGVAGNSYAGAEVSLWYYSGPYITESKIRASLHLFNYLH